MTREFITSTTKEYFLPEQNMSFNILMVQRLGDNHLEQIKSEYDVRRGECVVLREVTKKLYKFSSRFLHLQPDGSNDYFSWCGNHEEPEYTTLNIWKWTGKRWKEVS